MLDISEISTDDSKSRIAVRKFQNIIKHQISKRKKHDFGVQGSYETGNIGDRALGKMFEYQIQQAGYSVRTFNKDTTSSNTSNRVLGGGGVLHDWYGVDHLKRRLAYVTGGEHGFISGVGVPGFHSEEARKLAAKALPQVDTITVRDEWSRENIREVCDIDVTVTACPAFLYEDPDVDTTGKTGVNFRPYFDQPPKTPNVLSNYFGYSDLQNANKRYIQNITDICEELDDPIFIPFHYKDEEFARKHLDIPIKEYEFSVTETLESVSSVDRMVATRYHSLIFAAICNKPILAVAYEPKVESVANRLSLPSYKPHKDIPVEFSSPSNIDSLRKESKKNFDFLTTLPEN